MAEVALAAVAYVGVGAVWYHRTWGFGKYFLEDVTEFKGSEDWFRNTDPSNIGRYLFVEIVMATVHAYILSFAHLTNFTEAVLFSCWVWTAFCLPICVSAYSWESRPLRLEIIHAAKQLACIIAAACVFVFLTTTPTSFSVIANVESGTAVTSISSDLAEKVKEVVTATVAAAASAAAAKITGAEDDSIEPAREGL
eukprot:comp6786_c0_seq1/m.2535 comp6786_c0_seq1/g.2535  ORF comp6786_c0_seq1/g.2535 comp6786_c0_seq1/m.2535 type:complete len:196 (-) comp6786_c0_seq1:161-748(-)